MTMQPVEIVVAEILVEAHHAMQKFGPQTHLADGTDKKYQAQADLAKRATDLAAAAGQVTWMQILGEEFMEACAEEDPVLLRKELLQVAAVAIRWIDAIDERA